MRGALARASAGAVALTRPRTLAELVPPFLQWFELVRRRMPHTVAAYRFDLARFLEFCAQAKLSTPEQVTFQHCEFYLGWILTTHKVSPRTANRHLHALRSFWRWMIREGLATSNAPQETFMLPTEHRLPMYLSVVEQERVLATLARGTTLRARRDYA
jgi:integrase/recombinase XerC